MPAAIQWTPEIEQDITQRIVCGESIASIFSTPDYPSERAFYYRKATDDEFCSAIARAQEQAQDAWIDKTLHMAMTATAETWQLVQMQIRSIQWTAGKHKPKKYGDKVQQEHTGEAGGPIQIISTIPRPPKD